MADINEIEIEPLGIEKARNSIMTQRQILDSIETRLSGDQWHGWTKSQVNHLSETLEELRQALLVMLDDTVRKLDEADSSFAAKDETLAQSIEILNA